jgi:hypothetical protein
MTGAPCNGAPAHPESVVRHRNRSGLRLETPRPWGEQPLKTRCSGAGPDETRGVRRSYHDLRGSRAADTFGTSWFFRGLCAGGCTTDAATTAGGPMGLGRWGRASGENGCVGVPRERVRVCWGQAETETAERDEQEHQAGRTCRRHTSLGVAFRVIERDGLGRTPRGRSLERGAGECPGFEARHGIIRGAHADESAAGRTEP